MKIIGHRGARGLAPENTIAGLQKALEHGVDELEFDLRVTKDGIVILHHDRLLVDPNGKNVVIADSTYEELRRHKKDLPTLETVLKTIGNRAPLYIEVKHGEPTAPVVRILKEHLAKGWQPESFLLGSKSQKILRELHRALPDIEKIVIEPFSGIRAVYRARQVDAKRLSMQQLWLWWGFIRVISSQGWQLSGYAINDPRKARKWARWGLAGVITDYPDRFEK
ncbi:MAG TPA: glycerophosphodiester phosphodiesterase [Candidatus Saccharimonadales bacterium]|nr:glycerophosphodiester phosphodiesterase [Candidatus Saccharimonadales bacterium]